MWRIAQINDDGPIIEMSRALYEEDPATGPVPEAQTRQTLSILRSEPVRGTAVVLEIEREVAAYALLISFWSNELGGEVCVIDELYVRPGYRNRGHGRELIRGLRPGNNLWPQSFVALELEVTPDNKRAAALYAELGFEPVKNARLRRSTID